MSLFSDKLKKHGLSWYCLQVRQGREDDVRLRMIEKQAALLLDEISEIIIPEPVEEIKKKTNEEDLYKFLKGYMFIKTSLDSNKYEDILSIQGVHNFLCNIYVDSDLKRKVFVPAKIPDKQIENVRKCLETNQTIFEEKESFKEGDQIEFVDTAFKRMKGIIIEIASKNQVFVKLQDNPFDHLPIKVSVNKIIFSESELIKD